MDQKIAVLFMPDNIACTEEKTPLMLQAHFVLPRLTWMCAETDAGEALSGFLLFPTSRRRSDEALICPKTRTSLC